MTQPLMPRATAVWLIDNTALTFEQIADFCQLHLLEIQAIADGEVNVGMQGLDPLTNGQLSRTEIDRCQQDPANRLTMLESTIAVQPVKKPGPKYVPLAKRGDKPDAIAWLLKHHPELKDSQIAKLISTTRETIGKVRDRSHWNAANITARHPVHLGLCQQKDFEQAVASAGGQTAPQVSQLASISELP